MLVVLYLCRIQGKEDVLLHRLHHYCFFFQLFYHHRCRFRLFYYHRLRLVIYRRNFFVALAELNIQTKESIELPVGISCFLRVELVGQNVGVTFDVDRQAVIQTQVTS